MHGAGVKFKAWVYYSLKRECSGTTWCEVLTFSLIACLGIDIEIQLDMQTLLPMFAKKNDEQLLNNIEPDLGVTLCNGVA